MFADPGLRGLVHAQTHVQTMVFRGLGKTQGHSQKSPENKGSPKQNDIFNKVNSAEAKNESE